MPDLRFCPTFLHEFHNTLKPYPKSLEPVKNVILSLKDHPITGDAYPGFVAFHIRKIRIGLKAYNLSKREGLRCIYLLVGKSDLIIPIHIYKKGAYKKEHDVVHRIKQNLKSIIQEQSLGNYRQDFE